MKKVILIFIISIFLWISFSIATTLKWWDCQRLEEIKKIISDKQIFPGQFYEKAFTNLSQYCNWNKNVLNSKYFINHYLDVKFRYLDWFENNSDPNAKNRRNFLNQIAKNNYTTKDPNKLIKNLIEIYKKLRWSTNSNWILYQKYINTCNKLSSINSKIEDSNLKNNKANIINAYLPTKCKQLANQRKLQETALVQSIIYKIHYTTIQQRLFKTINQDFLKKWDNLYNKFVVSLWDFMYLVRRFIKSTDANTK